MLLLSLAHQGCHSLSEAVCYCGNNKEIWAISLNVARTSPLISLGLDFPIDKKKIINDNMRFLPVSIYIIL